MRQAVLDIHSKAATALDGTDDAGAGFADDADDAGFAEDADDAGFAEDADDAGFSGATFCRNTW